MIKLWTINRVLRWTGFLLIVSTCELPDDDPNRQPTRIGFKWIGLPPEKAWARHCEKSKAK